MHLLLSIILGNFSCHVWNAAGDGNYIYDLIVYTTPIIENVTHQNQTSINVIESTNVLLECRAIGTPTPKVCTESTYNYQFLFELKAFYTYPPWCRFNGFIMRKLSRKKHDYPSKVLMCPIKVKSFASHQMNMKLLAFYSI